MSHEIALDEIDKIADDYIKQIRETINDNKKVKSFLYIGECRLNLEKLSTLLQAQIAIKQEYFKHCIHRNGGRCGLTMKEKICCNPKEERDCSDFEYKKED